MRMVFWLVGVVVLVLVSLVLVGDIIKIGFVLIFSGLIVVIGNDMCNFFEFVFDYMGCKMDGKLVEVIYEDDGQKFDVGKQKIEKLVQFDKVDFIVGYIWLNVLLVLLKIVVDFKIFLILVNVGLLQFVGEFCLFYVFLIFWQNDQMFVVMGFYMNQKGVKSVFLIGLNYVVGKDMFVGVKSIFKGEIKGEEYMVWLSQFDFFVEFFKVCVFGVELIFVFYLGVVGVQFFN